MKTKPRPVHNGFKSASAPKEYANECPAPVATSRRVEGDPSPECSPRQKADEIVLRLNTCRSFVADIESNLFGSPPCGSACEKDCPQSLNEWLDAGLESVEALERALERIRSRLV